MKVIPKIKVSDMPFFEGKISREEKEKSENTCTCHCHKPKGSPIENGIIICEHCSYPTPTNGDNNK